MEVAKAEKSKGQGEHGVKTAETRDLPATGESSVCVCEYLCVCVFVKNTRSVSLLAAQRAGNCSSLALLGRDERTPLVQTVHWMLSLVDWEGKIPWVPKPFRAGIP